MHLVGSGFQNGLDDPESVLTGDPVGQGDGGRPGAGIYGDRLAALGCLGATLNQLIQELEAS